MKLKISLRRKGKHADGRVKYLLEKYENNKIIETRTLMKPEKLWELHSPDKRVAKPSLSTKKEDVKSSQNYAYSSLTEPRKKDKSGTDIDDMLSSQVENFKKKVLKDGKV